jgi:hypothetical protein
MNTTKFNLLSAIVLLSLFLLISCDSQATSYNKICDIYETVIKQDVSLDEKEVFITKSMYEQFPEFTEGNFRHITTASANERYALLKRSVELITETTWDCEAARVYYETEFKKKK